MAKTSLERSHSKLSNFKLTLICAILAISFAFVWVGLGIVKYNDILGYSVAGVSGVLFIFSFFMIGRFTR